MKGTRQWRRDASAHTRTRFLAVVAVGVLALAAAYDRRLRPRMLRWGCTEEEANRSLPGDDEFSDQPTMSTRGITIDAPPSAVWPWLVQVGYGRAGWYSHDVVERLLLAGSYAEGHSAIRIHPELQRLSVGDEVPFARFAGFPVTALDPERHLCIGSWSFVLGDLPGGRTRLLVRTRGAGWLRGLLRRIPLLRSLGAVVDYAIGEPLHHVMERRMLLGLAARAQGDARPSDPEQKGQAT